MVLSMSEATALRTHTCGSLRQSDVKQQATLCGWVHARRDHGGVRFIDLRDRYGMTQVVLKGVGRRESGVGSELHDEDVVCVNGAVAARPDKLRNPKLATGDIEVHATALTVLTRAKTPPFEIARETDVSEDVRLKYRYLDLRHERLQHNLAVRDQLETAIRAFLHTEGFLEIETPILTRSTPEGARDYVVPSRLHTGKFYALPQSPQQYKQLLMVAGFDRYFQIARCFRDEDQRVDRGAEFTQLDLEMSFVEREDILSMTERLFTEVCTELGFPPARTPFPRLTHAEAMERYGSDKPDLRTEKEKHARRPVFAWVLDFPLFEAEKVEGHFTPSHHMFTAPLPDDIPLLDTAPEKARSTQYDLVCNGLEIGGGSIRIHQRELQEKIFGLVGLNVARAREQFGHLLEAFEFGVPPHGGIAPGIDRLLMAVLSEPNIREVVAFPKNQTASDPMMGAPAALEPKQLRELHIKLT